MKCILFFHSFRSEYQTILLYNFLVDIKKIQIHQHGAVTHIPASCPDFLLIKKFCNPFNTTNKSCISPQTFKWQNVFVTVFNPLKIDFLAQKWNENKAKNIFVNRRQSFANGTKWLNINHTPIMEDPCTRDLYTICHSIFI